VWKDCVPACLILSQQRSPAQLDASPIPPSTGMEQGNTWLAMTTASQKTHTNTHKHPHTYLSAFCPVYYHQIFSHCSHENENKNTSRRSYRSNTCSFCECIHPRHLTLLPPSPFPLYLGRLVEFFLLWSAV